MKKILYLSLISIPVGIILLYVILLSFKLEDSQKHLVLDIPEGSSVSSVAQTLYEAKCFSKADIFAFKLAMKMSFKENKIYTGRYNLKELEVSSIGDLINSITSNTGTKITLTFIEGWGIEHYASKLQNEIGIDSSKFVQLCNSDYISRFGIKAPSCEGYLYPDTYDFLTSYNEKQIFDRMVNQFLNKYNNFIKNGAEARNMSMNETVALASIIQGEAAKRSEMNIISSVYHNRLTKGMRLEADPTVQYVIPGENRRLTFKDLEVDRPYNTYKNKGLPPGPISNPGLSALMAAINPEKTNYLYFVADTKGGHMFGKTLTEHKKNVRIYKKRRRAKQSK